MRIQIFLRKKSAEALRCLSFHKENLLFSRIERSNTTALIKNNVQLKETASPAAEFGRMAVNKHRYRTSCFSNKRALNNGNAQLKMSKTLKGNKQG